MTSTTTGPPARGRTPDSTEDAIGGEETRSAEKPGKDGAAEVETKAVERADAQPERDRDTDERPRRGRDSEDDSAVQRRRGAPEPAPEAHASLNSESGTTRIADVVVAKIAGMATREIPGVHSMGGGLARKVGQLRALVPGTGDAPAATQGVSVEVGEKEAAVDLQIVTWYGESIADVADAVRDNVIDRVETMTGLHVVEVNINVNDIHLDSDDDSDSDRRGGGSSTGEPRVQ